MQVKSVKGQVDRGILKYAYRAPLAPPSCSFEESFALLGIETYLDSKIRIEFIIVAVARCRSHIYLEESRPCLTLLNSRLRSISALFHAR